jgi:hypothetical protein
MDVDKKVDVGKKVMGNRPGMGFQGEGVQGVMVWGAAVDQMHNH